MITDEDLVDLAVTSERIGRNISLIQGPGGNTSIKDDEELWVKASGFWLSDALRMPIFVAIDRAAIGGARENYDIPARAILEGRSLAGRRPSIETALHALMPHRVVIHAHAVNAMTISVLPDGEAFATRHLDGLNWSWLPYCRPGAPLARMIDEVMRADGPDVIILQNHGVVVGASTSTAAEALLEEVETRLAMPTRSMPAWEPFDSGVSTSARFEPAPAAAPFAHDTDALRVLTGGALIPDQVVFLGGAVPTLAPGGNAESLADSLEAASGVVPALILLPGIGALALRSRSPAAEALVSGLLAIAERIPSGMPVNTLDDAEVAGLLNWDAEKYRQTLNTAPHP